MKKISYLLLLFAMIFYAPLSFATASYKLLVFGDSLSAGYRVGSAHSFATLLHKELQKKGYKNVQVVNESKSGETTSGGLNRLEKIVQKVQPNGVILELGINDVFKGIAVSTIENNLSQMIELCQKKEINVLLVGMKAPPYTSLFYQREFEKMYQKLASTYHLILYPFFMKGLIALENGAPVSRYTLSDQIHPNEQGILLMVQNILPYVEKFLKENK